MSNLVRTSVSIPREVDNALDELAHEHRTSKAEIHRRALRDALLEGDWDLPEPEKVQLARERTKNRGRVNYLRGGFEGRVYDEHKKVFKNGWSPEDIKLIQVNFINEARDLWPEDPETRQEKIEYVRQVNEAARNASEVSDFDRLDPENFEKFSGVEAGRDRQDTEGDLDDAVEDVKRRLRSASRKGSTLSDPDLVRSVSNEYGLVEEVAIDAVETARDELAEEAPGGVQR